jgi:hypothetical protein
MLEAIAELREPTSSTTVSDQNPVTTPASWLNRFDCRARPYLAGACPRFTGEVLFTSGSQARGSKQFHHAAPTRSIHAICCSAALSFQGEGRRYIGHPGVVGGSPIHHPIRTELRSEPRLNVRTGAIGQREVGLAGKAGATEEYAHLREWEPRSVQGDPRSIANDHEPTVPVTARAMRRQAARVGAPRQKVVPKGSVLRQVRADAPPIRLLLYFMSGNSAS